MNVAESEPVTPQAARRWYQCSTRTLALLVLIGTMVCLPVAVVAHNSKRRSERQGMSAAPGRLESFAWRNCRSVARFDCPIPAPGDGFGIDLHGAADDGSLANLRFLTVSPVRAINLECSQITDAGLESLGRFDHLLTLDLDGTAVTDAGLKHLVACGQLRWLSLRDTQVSDAGLEHLKGLSELERLELCGTKVTEVGLKEFQKVRPKCKIEFGATDSTFLPYD